MPRIVLVIPASMRSRTRHQSIPWLLELPGHDLQTLFVNDGSRDGTLRILSIVAAKFLLTI